MMASTRARASASSRYACTFLPPTTQLGGGGAACMGAGGWIEQLRKVVAEATGVETVEVHDQSAIDNALQRASRGGRNLRQRITVQLEKRTGGCCAVQ